MNGQTRSLILQRAVDLAGRFFQRVEGPHYQTEHICEQCGHESGIFIIKIYTKPIAPFPDVVLKSYNDLTAASVSEFTPEERDVFIYDLEVIENF